MIDVKECLSACEEKMQMSVMYLEDSLSHIRAGKANVHILDAIRINSYGSMVPLNNVSAARPAYHCHQALGQIHVQSH